MQKSLELITDQINLNYSLNKILIKWEKFDYKIPLTRNILTFIRKGDPYDIFLNCQSEFKQDKERKKLRIQQFFSYGYFDIWKNNSIECQTCVNKSRWKFNHIRIHSGKLYMDYLAFEQCLNEILNRHLCPIKNLNLQLQELIQKHVKLFYQ